MVDWTKPIRSASTQRRLYMVGWDRIKRGYLVASLPGANPKTCALYAHDGQPLDTSVLGYVENVPEVSVGNPIVEIEHVEKANAINPVMREQRAAERRAEIAAENDSNPLWGMF